MNNNNIKFDSPLFLVVLILLVLGIVMVYSASSFKAQEFFKDSHHFLLNHILRVVIGITAMYLAIKIDYHNWLRLSPVLLIITFGTLIYLLVGPGVEKIRGSSRWIIFGKFQFQPSEFARIALIMFLSSSLGKEDSKIKSLDKSLIIYTLIIGSIAIPIWLQPDVGTAALMIFTGLVLLFLGGEKLWHLFLFGLTVIPFFIIFLFQVSYQKIRLVEFFASLKGRKLVWQTQQSLISLGNGGPFGLGLGGSKQKYHFLPDPFTDFIFAIVGEELGIIGTLITLILFMLLIWRGFEIARNAPDTQGILLAAGIVLNVAVYALTNAGVVVNLLPTTGIPMPFLSYGGSALIANLFAIGILLNISAQIWHRQRLYPINDFNYYRGVRSKRYGSAKKS